MATIVLVVETLVVKQKSLKISISQKVAPNSKETIGNSKSSCKLGHSPVTGTH